MTDLDAPPFDKPAQSAPRAGALGIENVGVRFGQIAVLSDVTLDVSAGEIICLLGPSGSGKSTLLRVIAGIERLSAGRIVIDGSEMDGPSGFVEPERRRVGMVFQDYALFPHLTVEDNVAFGLGRCRLAPVAALLERLGLSRHARSYPHTLSGGEQQRLALARAMAPRPRILLMDEPFSSLDTELREDVRRHTLSFLRESRTTAVLVTHDADEAREVADRIALLRGGRLVRHGAPADVCPAPRSSRAPPAISPLSAP